MRKLLAKRLWIIMVGLVLSLGPWSSVLAGSNTLTVGFPTDPRSLDPGAATRDYTGYASIAAIYDGLVQYARLPQPDGTVKVDTTKVEPLLAERWENNADMSEWTFYLRKDARFHSGNPVNAAAVKYTFARYLKIKQAASTVLWLSKVTEEGMEVVDETTIKFKLTGPNPLFLDYMQMLNLGIQDPAVIEANGGVEPGKVNEWVAKNDAGSGPFKLVSYKPGVQLVFEKFDGYWGPKPQLDKVVFKIIPDESTRSMLLEREKIDICWNIPAKDFEPLSQKKNLKIVSRTTTKINYIDMKRGEAPFNDPKIRQALAFSFPYDKVIKEVLYGRAVQMNSPASVGNPGHEGSFFHYKQDLEKAKALLAEAGAKDFAFTLELGEGRIPNNKEIAVTWQADLKKIGVNMDLKVLPQAVFLDKLKAKQVPIFMVSWTSFVTDPWYQFTFLLGSKSFCNYANIDDKQLDEWIEQASVLVDREERYALAKKVQEYVSANDLWLYMFQPIADSAMVKNVMGFCMNPDDSFHVRTIFMK